MKMKKEIMKMNQLKKVSIVTALSVFCLVATLQAQTAPGKVEKAIASMTNLTEMPTFDIEFPGGTPEELILQIAKVSGTRPNVIIPGDIGDTQIPRFKLQNVNIRQVFEALNMVTDEKGLKYLHWMNEGSNFLNPVWVLSKLTHPRPAAETCQVTFIGNLLESFQLDDINAAIRTAWEMIGKTTTASLKFHKETKLLIAKGNDQELNLVQEVLKSLQLASNVKKVSDSKKPQ
jgi:hypothetical protein